MAAKVRYIVASELTPKKCLEKGARIMRRISQMPHWLDIVTMCRPVWLSWLDLSSI